MPKIINKGFLPEVPKPEQWRFGVATNIEIATRVPDCNWKQWMTDDELQKQNNFESMSCVSQSAINTIQAQLNWLLNHGMSDAGKSFLYNNGYIIDGKIQISKRHVAIMSNTSPDGNYFTTVGDAIRLHKDGNGYGLIPESMLPFDGANSWTTYYDKTKITDAMLALGREFLNYFQVNYHWLYTEGDGTSYEQRRAIRLEHLKQCPEWVGMNGHATIDYMGVNKVKWVKKDSYSPFDKIMAWEYDPPFAMGLIIDNKPMYEPQEIANAQKLVLSNMKGRPTHYFFRPDAKGECYKSYLDGSFKYFLGIPSPLFTEMCQDKTITPIPEELWNKIKPAELK